MPRINIYGSRSSRGHGEVRFPPREPEPPAEVRVSHWTPEQVDAYLEKTGQKRRKKNIEEALTMKKQPIDLSQFDIVPMQLVNRSPAPTATIADTGKLVLNAALVKCASDKRVSVYLSKDAKTLLFMPAENGEFHIPAYAGGIAKGNTCNRGAGPLRDMAKARGLPVPAKFSFEWDEDVGGYVGQYIEPAALAPKAARTARRK